MKAQYPPNVQTPNGPGVAQAFTMVNGSWDHVLVWHPKAAQIDTALCSSVFGTGRPHGYLVTYPTEQVAEI